MDDLEIRALNFAAEFWKNLGVEEPVTFDTVLNDPKYTANEDIIDLLSDFFSSENGKMSKDIDLSSYIPNRSVLLSSVLYPVYVMLNLLGVTSFPRNPLEKPLSLTPRILAELVRSSAQQELR